MLEVRRNVLLVVPTAGKGRLFKASEASVECHPAGKSGRFAQGQWISKLFVPSDGDRFDELGIRRGKAREVGHNEMLSNEERMSTPEDSVVHAFPTT